MPLQLWQAQLFGIIVVAFIAQFVNVQSSLSVIYYIANQIKICFNGLFFFLFLPTHMTKDIKGPGLDIKLVLALSNAYFKLYV